MWRAVALAAVAFALGSATALPSVESDEAALDSYLRGTQLPDGAFANSDAANETHVTPYRGAYAAIGLALDGDAAPALAFAQWYVSNANAENQWGPGCTIYDFTFSRHPFAIAPTHSAGAMDAPAGVFLTALHSLYATGDGSARDWIKTHKSDAECIARAAYGLYDPRYRCTAAIIGYDFCLAEDNFEVWRGLGDVAWLEANVWNDATMQTTYLTEQANVGAGLAEMWDASNQTYSWARSTRTGAFTRSSWSQFYPGSVTQLWPVIAGYASPDDPRSIALWRNFKAAWPDMTSVSPVRNPWPWTATAAAKMGDLEFVAAYTGCLNASYAARGYPYSWEVHDGGNMLTALVWAQEYPRRHWPRQRRRASRYSCLIRY